MSVFTIHILHGIQTPAQFYSQVEEATPAPAAQHFLGQGAGLYQPLFRGIRGLKPEVPFRTTQLATLLTEAGIFGADLSAGNTDLYYRKATNLGTRVALATATHTRLRMAKAMLYWRRITARHNAESSADAHLLALYDGSNAPLDPVGSVACAGTPTAAEFFSLGPVVINQTPIAGITEADIDLGIELIQAGSASEPYDTFVGIRSINPVITLRGLSLEAWTSVGLVGTALTSLSVYLRRANSDASGGAPYVADAVASHIKFTATNGLIAVQNTQGGGHSEATTGLQLHLRAASASTNALAVTVGSTIT